MAHLAVAMDNWDTTSKGAARFLLVLGAACATHCGLSGDGTGATATESGEPSDGGRSVDGSHAFDGTNRDGSHRAAEGASDVAPSDSGHAGDGDGHTDSAHASDGPTTTDGPVVTDGPSRIDGARDGGFVSPLAVDLGTAANYVILTETGISTGATTAITGNLGVSPAAAASITGFALTLDATNMFSTSAMVTGKVFGADYAVPTPAALTLAIVDLQRASVDAAGRSPDVTELGAGNIGGLTLPRGVYAWSTGLLVPDDVTLVGSASDVWIFQIAQTLTVSDGKRIVLTGGATAENVFWDVAGTVTLGTSAHVEGVMVAQTSIALGTSASVKGRLLAETAVTMAASVVVGP
jgi:hypothetical protein